MAAFMFCIGVTCLSALNQPVAVTGYVIPIEAAHGHVLGRAQVTRFVCSSVQAGRTEGCGWRSKRVGTPIVGEPIGKLDHRARVTA
jgi:hypothetical protein